MAIRITTICVFYTNKLHICKRLLIELVPFFSYCFYIVQVRISKVYSPTIYLRVSIQVNYLQNSMYGTERNGLIYTNINIKSYLKRDVFQYS